MSDKTILLIDDDISVLKLLDIRLRRHDGYQVLVAQNGEQGLELARNEQPDLILLDWEMPDKDGISVLKELKNNEITRNIAVVMLTGRNLVGELEQAFALEAEGYLIKPVDLVKVSHKLTDVLNNRSVPQGNMMDDLFRILRGNL